MIAGNNVRGMIQFIRVQHGYDDDSGFSAVLDRGNTRQTFKNDTGFQNDLLRKLGTQEAAQQFMGTLQQAWTDATRQNIVHQRWTATGYGTLTDQSKTRRIRGIVLGGGRIY